MKTLRNDGLDFVCETDAELWRARTLLTKEPGTIAWLKKLRLGDVFFDVGANIGCYTLYAARQVGDAGFVYAFEPHLGSAMALLRNVAVNGFGDRVRVLTCALSGSYDHSFAPFYYQSLTSGSTGSQIAAAMNEHGKAFIPAALEMKVITTLSSLIASDVVPSPSVVKVDVDGNEFDILRGLFGAAHPREVQVETRPSNRAAVLGLMTASGYAQVVRHRTSAGEEMVRAGAAPDAITDNTIFERTA